MCTGATPYPYVNYMVNGSNFLQILYIYQRPGNVHFLSFYCLFRKLYMLTIFRCFLGRGFLHAGPGLWSMTISTTPTSATENSCQVQIRAQSTIQLYYGFVTDVHNDFIYKEPLIVPGPGNFIWHDQVLNINGWTNDILKSGLRSKQLYGGSYYQSNDWRSSRQCRRIFGVYEFVCAGTTGEACWFCAFHASHWLFLRIHLGKLHLSRLVFCHYGTCLYCFQSLELDRIFMHIQLW